MTRGSLPRFSLAASPNTFPAIGSNRRSRTNKERLMRSAKRSRECGSVGGAIHRPFTHQLPPFASPSEFARQSLRRKSSRADHRHKLQSPALLRLPNSRLPLDRAVVRPSCRYSVLTGQDKCSYFVLMESSGPKRRFPPPWQVHRDGMGPLVVSDAKGVPLAYVHCRDDLQGIGFAHNHLTSDEGCAIGLVSRLAMQRWRLRSTIC